MVHEEDGKKILKKDPKLDKYLEELASGKTLHLRCVQFYAKNSNLGILAAPDGDDRSSISVKKSPSSNGNLSGGDSKRILEIFERKTSSVPAGSNPKFRMMTDKGEWTKSPSLRVYETSSNEKALLSCRSKDTSSSSIDGDQSRQHEIDTLESQLSEIEQFLREDIQNS